ncbi:alpha/beta hydrolase [Sphaerisporangium perillae]|uniref:alpha/beta hydrolase n=1 Tax=Sphaerisporangium perillae TaxID=2935860 RepID=UPI00200EB7AF|nr:alpha/beta hydrolase [Sphaerisporangium perillae]
MTTSKTLDVPGARLRYVLRGTGPLLLLIAGGDGDAAASDGLASHLTDGYTVLTYDRRGLSGSTATDPADPVTVTTHADDVHHLLAMLTTEPVQVYGSSIGAMIALELVSRHPEQVSVLVAHEPPATQLLPETERDRARQAQKEIEDIHATEGVIPALRKFVILAGVDLADREPDARIMAPGPDRLPNLEFFLTHDAPAVGRHELDMDALKAASTRIVPAVGETSAHVWPHHCGRLLAEALGTSYVEFPGGHNGGVLRPRAFATRLIETLKNAQSLTPDHNGHHTAFSSTGQTEEPSSPRP